MKGWIASGIVIDAAFLFGGILLGIQIGKKKAEREMKEQFDQMSAMAGPPRLGAWR